MKRLLAMLVTLLVSIAAIAQEDSVLEQSREVLRFGIDSEVMDLLDRLEDRGEDRLDAELLMRLQESRNRELQGRILEHFEEREVPIAGEAVSAILMEADRLDPAFLRISVRYLSEVAEVRSVELLERYEDIARDDDLVAASVAIRAIGSDGGEEAISLLMELYDDLRDTDLRGAVLRAFGDAKATSAVDKIMRIVTDPYEESTLRHYGVESLGKIGDPASLDAVLSVLDDENSLLRAYATAALGGFDDPAAARALDEGLRDSFWRVRVAALQGIAALGAAETLEAVSYKARRDPEAPVRTEAIRALAAIGTGESYEILRQIASETRSPQSDRILAVQLLTEKDLAASLEVINGIIEAEWSVENSRLLDSVAQALVRTESDTLADIYERMLTHPNFIIQVYAIRGIGRSGMNQFGDRLIAVARKHETGIMHTAAVAALERLGIPLPTDEEDGETGSDPGVDESAAPEEESASSDGVTAEDS